MVNAWVEGARPRTLPAAVVPVAVGTACVVGVGDMIWWRAGAAMIVALALQVATNYANDYSDGIRGTDSDERRVGPIRLVGSGLKSPSAVKKAALASFGVAGSRRPRAGDRRRARVARRRRGVDRCRLVLHRRTQAVRLRRDSVRCSCSCSSAWSPQSGSTYVQLEEVTGLSLGLLGGGGRCWPRHCSS